MLSSCVLYYLVQHRGIFMLESGSKWYQSRKALPLALLLWELCMVIPLPCFTTASFLSYSVHSILLSFVCFFFLLPCCFTFSAVVFCLHSDAHVASDWNRKMCSHVLLSDRTTRMEMPIRAISGFGRGSEGWQRGKVYLLMTGNGRMRLKFIRGLY